MDMFNIVTTHIWPLSFLYLYIHVKVPNCIQVKLLQHYCKPHFELAFSKEKLLEEDQSLFGQVDQESYLDSLSSRCFWWDIEILYLKVFEL